MEFETIYQNIKTSFEEQTGYPVLDDTDLGIRMKVVAGELAHISQQIADCEKQLFPQTATGIYLEHHGVCRDIYKKPAAAARGTLRFSRSSAAAQDITIPYGTLCTSSSVGGTMYMTEEDRILEKGKTSVDVPGIAAEPGTGGNILAGKIDTLVSTVAGISTVTNSSNFSGGMAEESDTSLRKRILESFINTSNGANAKFYKDFALKYDQVSFANTEYQASNNILKLYISDYFRMVDNDLVTQLQNDIQAEKELNVNVQVAAATPVTQNIEATIYVTETRNTSRKQSAAVSYLMQKMYELGIGEAFNPYSIAHDITDQIGDVLAISFEQPSTMVEISAGQIIEPGMINISVECL